MATQALSIFYGLMVQDQNSTLVAAFAACVGEGQWAALASDSVRGAILHGAPQAAEVAALEIGRGRGVRQEYATDFARGAAIYNWRDIYNWFRFWFWFFRFFVSADKVTILYERFERSEIFGWDI